MCGINSVVGGIYNPLHLSRKKGAFSEQECCRGVKFRKPRSGGPGLLCKVVDDAIDLRGCGRRWKSGGLDCSPGGLGDEDGWLAWRLRSRER